MNDYEPLAERARRLRGVLANQARRAFVLELTGTPKAGKTSTIRLLETFFKTCGWRVHVVKERAAECPIPMKGHFFFNAWTTCTMMAEVLETADREYDLVIVDRGFFDALIWLELQRSRQQVDETEARIFEDFVTLKRWRKLIDLTIVLSVAPDVAIVREGHDRLLPRRASLMNESSLQSFNEARERATARHGAKFRLSTASAEGASAKEVAANVIATVIDHIRPWADPEVAVVPRATLEGLTGSPRVTQHAGLVFRARIDDETVARSLEEKEFKTSGRGHPATSSFVALEALAKVQLEPWSGKVFAENWLTPPA